MTSAKASNGSLTAELVPPSQTESPRSLSRSPHPYHRRSSSLQEAQKAIRQPHSQYNGSAESTESEERATEADDEKGTILKGLPAPPLRGRKGLKGSISPADLTPAISPCPTPPLLSDRRRAYFREDKAKRAGEVNAASQERALEAYQKYVKRRRAEIARRCTEAALLASIGVAACRNAVYNHTLAEIWYPASGSMCLLAGLYLLFPIRIMFHKLRNGNDLRTSIKTGFHIPSRFDPGPLMYPILLPFFISVSLAPSQTEILTTNLILGLSSLPQKLIPYSASSSSGWIHWTLSSTPLILGIDRAIVHVPVFEEPHSLVQEDMILLFPLHQATLATLRSLTLTSLDPAEIQLLSTGLVNLYLFASSPQAEILKSLLWIGSLCLFISCQKPFSWEVRIARIPSWKFARNKSPKTGLLSMLEYLFGIVLPKNRYRQGQVLGSDDEDYDHLKSARRMARYQTRLRKSKTSGPQSDLEPILSDRERDFMQSDTHGLKRSLILSPNGNSPSTTLHTRKASLNTPSAGLLSLTYTQAQACKWLISVYVFSMVIAIILVVVRYYVSVQALSSHEPFGWAIGYLFGNIQSLRLWAVSNNMEEWIILPGHARYNTAHCGSGWIERTRQNEFGPANVRLLISAYCIVVLTSGIGIVLQLGAIVEVDTRRKVFHGIMVGMLLPTILVDPCFIALALSLILAIFLLLDLFRASQLPPISRPLTNFLAPYVDGRDYRGPVIVSHIFLLIGCAIPLWLSLAGAPRTGEDPWRGWDTNLRDVSMTSGVICVGMGDAAASLIGRRYGRTKWFWGGGKSLEGSLAFALAVTVGLAASYTWLRIGGWAEWDARLLPVALLKMAVAGSGASLLETVLTAGNDNVIVPIGLWLLTRGLQI